MSAGGGRFIVVNGVPRTSGVVPPISSFLESISGAYTTTRTGGNGRLVLFWDRHLRRLAESARILAECRPDLFGLNRVPPPESFGSLIHDSLRSGLALAMGERDGRVEDELAITALVRGRREREEVGLDVFLHIGFYAQPAFGIATGAHLAVAGLGRDLAAAKYSDWARIRKGLERMRPPSATELLLTNDGDRILEGTVTNFFVVCRRGDMASSNSSSDCPYEVQTASITDGVLPGVIRQLVIDVCSTRGIPLKEFAPSWSDRELWEEAFVTSSLRLVQHVETIQVPSSCERIHLITWREVSWVVKRFEGIGQITSQIQKEINERATADGYQIRQVL